MGLSPADLQRQDDLAELNAALEQLRSAVTDEGIAPRYHREIMARSRHDWPVLWAAIDRLLAAEPVLYVTD